MSSSLAAGTELYLCLRCEARSLINKRWYFARSHFRTFGVAGIRSFSLEKSHGAESADLSNRSNTVQDSRIVQGEPLRLARGLSDHSTDDIDSRSSTTNDSQEFNLGTVGRLRRDVPQYEDENRNIASEGISIRRVRLEKHNDVHEVDHDKLKYPAYRHPDVASDRVELGLERLGEPATIRVLPEGTVQGRAKGKHSKRFKLSKKDDDAEQSDWGTPASFDSIVKAMDSKENRVANTAEALNNIETLRRAFLKSINQFEGPRQEECNKLAKSLERGFTSKQLQGYQKLSISMKRPEPDGLDMLSITERLKVSRWYAGPSGWPGDALKRLWHKEPRRTKIRRGTSPGTEMGDDGDSLQDDKQVLVNNILSLCWGLRSVEEKLQDGSVALHIERQWLTLLLQQDEPVFQQVSTLFNVKTEISERHKLIRVSGTYQACVDAVRMIKKSVETAQVEQVTLIDEDSSERWTVLQHALLKDMAGNGLFWRQTEEQTQTKIMPVASAPFTIYTKVNVLYLSTSTKGLAGAKRRISQLQQMLKQEPIPYLYAPLSSQNFTSLVSIPKSSNMALMDQNFSWCRWRPRLSLPLDFDRYKDAASVIDSDGSTFLYAGSDQSEEIVKRLFLFWERLRIQVSKVFLVEQFAPDYWIPQPRTSIIASLGHLVYAVPDKVKSLVPKAIKESVKKLSKAGTDSSPEIPANIVEKIFQHRRVMTAGIPSLMDALKELISDDSTMSNFFKIVLTPKMINGDVSISTDKVPTLELEVSINESTKTTSLQRVNLVLNREYVDLVLPQSASDVRFTTETMVLGRESNIDPAITDFIKNCDLDVWGKGQFDTPSSLTLKLPEEVFQLSGYSSVSNVHKESEIEKWNQPIKGQVVGLEAVKMQDLHIDRSLENADHQRSAAVDKGSLNKSHVRSAKTSSGVASTDRVSAQLVEVEYICDSLAVHSKLQSLYQGFPLAFSTIEAGQIGGKQQVLEVETPGIADVTLQSKGQSRKSLQGPKAYFMAFYGSLSELISRLPK